MIFIQLAVQILSGFFLGFYMARKNYSVLNVIIAGIGLGAVENAIFALIRMVLT